MSERKRFNPIKGCALPVIGLVVAAAVGYEWMQFPSAVQLPALNTGNDTGAANAPVSATFTPVPYLPPEAKKPDAQGCLPDNMAVINDKLLLTQAQVQQGVKMIITRRGSSESTTIYACSRRDDPNDPYWGEGGCETLFSITHDICAAEEIK